MQRDRAPAFAVRDLDSETEQIPELTLERGEVGVDRAGSRITRRFRLGWPVRAHQLFDLTDRKPVANDLGSNL